MTDQLQTFYKKEQSLTTQNRKRFALIERINKRFATYGYEPIDIPTYESYDLYTSIKGTVHHRDMVKTIDSSGEVLVLRPDATIPIMKQVAKQHKEQLQNFRYYYTLKVFRHSFGKDQQKERTQSGVELLGDNSIEADAELIALAIHCLKDLGITDFKIELNHSQFLNRLLEQVQLTEEQNKRLKQLIHSKNLIELTPFLKEHVTQPSLRQMLQHLPLMYGALEDIFKEIKVNALFTSMKRDLDYLQRLYQILKDYGVEQHIIIDLGLINPMEYYSGVIFQGFVPSVGKPVLMGGRYDQLAKQFQANLPAIGFAIDIETLLLGLAMKTFNQETNMINLTYDSNKRKEAITFATILRDLQYHVLMNDPRASFYNMDISFQKEKITVLQNDEIYYFQSTEEVIDWLKLRGKNIDIHNTSPCQRKNC